MGRKGRTAAETAALREAVWSEYSFEIPRQETMARHDISQTYYYEILDSVAERLKREYTVKLGRSMMSLISQKRRAYRRCMSHYAEALEAAKQEPTTKAQRSMMSWDAKAWLREAREEHKELVETLMRLGLLPSVPQSEVTVNNAVVVKSPIVSEFEAAMSFVKSKRNVCRSSSDGVSSGQPIVEEGTD